MIHHVSIPAREAQHVAEVLAELMNGKCLPFGPLERMNRTIKQATVQRYHCDDHGQLKRHLADFLHAYNFGRRLKTVKGLTPYEFVCKSWASEPQRFTAIPLHQMPGLNTWPVRRSASSDATQSVAWPGTWIRGLASAEAREVLGFATLDAPTSRAQSQIERSGQAAKGPAW
jgi:hypothetical protein